MSEPNTDLATILEVLPPKGTSLLLDEVIGATAERVVAARSVRDDEPWCAGHFPGHPVMPGVLVIEAMAQACALLHWCNMKRRELPLHLGRCEAKFVGSVRPGDRLDVAATRIKCLPEALLAEAEASVEGRTVARARLYFGIPDGLSEGVKQ